MINTTRSDKIVGEFLAKNVPFKRKVQIFEKEFTFSLIVGFLCSIVYGIALSINAVTFISTWRQLLDP